MVSQKNIVARIIFSALGLCCIALGVSILTKAELGCTPIVAIPYSLSFIVPNISYGSWIIIFNFSLIIIQCILLKNIKLSNIMFQCILAICFGSFVNIFMFLIGDMIPDTYVIRIAAVITGCLFIATGAVMSLVANLAILPADGLTLAICATFQKEFGRVRILSDAVMALSALFICLWAFHQPLAVREGTILATLITGIFVKIIINFYKSVSHK